MTRKSWRDVATKSREDPERAARVEAGAHAMLLISALTQLREARGVTQTELASALAISQARVSQIEHQEDLTLSTLDQVVHGMGGELRINVKFPDKTVELLGSASSEPDENEEPRPNILITEERNLSSAWRTNRHIVLSWQDAVAVTYGGQAVKQADPSLAVAVLGKCLTEKLEQQTAVHMGRA